MYNPNVGVFLVLGGPGNVTIILRAPHTLTYIAEYAPRSKVQSLGFMCRSKARSYWKRYCFINGPHMRIVHI